MWYGYLAAKKEVKTPSKKNVWLPRVGQLVRCRGNKKIYHVIEITSEKFGFTRFLASGDFLLLELSTLNCDPVDRLVSEEESAI